MKAPLVAALLAGCALVTACKKKEAPVETPSAPAASASAPAAAAPAASVDREMAEKKDALDYSTMEDKYINDAHAQWATDAKASSTFGDDGGKTPADSNLAKNMTGAPDGKEWTNNKQDMGFDTIELSYAKPVTATEVRLVMKGDASEALSKVELQDEQGAWQTVWSGISDVKQDRRGNRTWFVKTFPPTTFKTKAVKYTIANNVVRGYKSVDSGQLVGD